MQTAISVVSFVYQFADNVAFLILCASGLAIIFGMMGVINFAHGEFIMLGAYTTALSVHMGLPTPFAMLLGTLAATAAGIIIERLVVRRLYGRLFDSIVATWAVSLIISQGTLVLLGPTMPGVSTPFGSFALGNFTFSIYRIVLMAIAALVVTLCYIFFNYTRYGIYARATMQRPDMASALGLNTGIVYSATFALGAALAGLTGALYAPTMTLVPTMGASFIVQAFVTVVVGGGDVLVGVTPAAGLLGLIQTELTTRFGSLIGQVGLLLAVILVVRVLPKGISGWKLKRFS